MQLIHVVNEKLHAFNYDHFNKKYPVAISHTIIGWYKYDIVPCTTIHVRSSSESQKKVGRTLIPITARTLQRQVCSDLIIEANSAFTWTFMNAEFAVNNDVSRIRHNPSSIYFDCACAIPHMNDRILNRMLSADDFNITNFPTSLASKQDVVLAVSSAGDIAPAFIKRDVVRPGILHDAQLHMQDFPVVEWNMNIILQRTGLICTTGDEITCSLCAINICGPGIMYGTCPRRQMLLCKYCNINCGDKLPANMPRLQTVVPGSGAHSLFTFTSPAVKKYGDHSIWSADTLSGTVIMCDIMTGDLPMIIAPLLLSVTDRIYVHVDILEV
jgi:hypothetical protein